MSPRWTPRPIIINALQEFQKCYDENNSAIAFLQLPTGYGKSTITLSLASHVISKGSLGRGVIHILPLRSIITDLSKRLHDWFPRMDLPVKEIATQHMGSSGSPFFVKPTVITTLDTFSLNLFKLPAVEVSKAFRTGNAHFEFPRGLIYSSIVVFDEAHLFALDSGRYKQMFTIFTAALTQLVGAGVPIFVITATLPRIMREYLQKKMMISESSIISKIYKKGDDPLFEKREGNRKIVTSVVSSDEEALRVVMQQNKGKTLIILNEVNRAMSFYKLLKNYDPILLHGRMIESERKENVNKLYASDSWLAIGTQVIEAGIDVDADLLVTDLAPIDRLVQRAGRVARSGRGKKGEICVIENYSGVYLEHDLKQSMQILDRQIPDIDWVFGGQKLVDDAYSNLDISTMLDNHLLRFLESVDQSLLYGTSDMKDLIDVIGSFPRETLLVKAYAEKSFSNCILTDNDGYFGLESSKAITALRNSKKIIVGNKVKDIDYDLLRFISPDNLPRIIEDRGYDGILLDKYESNVGYI